MDRLYIQPIEYSGKRLNELGKRVVSVYSSIFKDYEILEPLSKENLKEIQTSKESLKEIMKESWINGEKFNSFLKKPGKYILGVTGLPVTRNKNKDWVYGKGWNLTSNAFVSTFRPEFNKIDSNIHLERVIIEALHELGHVFELDHHYKRTETKNSKLCPMDVSLGKNVRKNMITWEEYISSRDSFSFCEECSKKLGI